MSFIKNIKAFRNTSGHNSSVNVAGSYSQTSFRPNAGCVQQHVGLPPRDALSAHVPDPRKPGTLTVEMAKMHLEQVKQPLVTLPAPVNARTQGRAVRFLKSASNEVGKGFGIGRGPAPPVATPKWVRPDKPEPEVKISTKRPLVESRAHAAQRRQTANEVSLKANAYLSTYRMPLHQAKERHDAVSAKSSQVEGISQSLLESIGKAKADLAQASSERRAAAWDHEKATHRVQDTGAQLTSLKQKKIALEAQARSITNSLRANTASRDKLKGQLDSLPAAPTHREFIKAARDFRDHLKQLERTQTRLQQRQQSLAQAQANLDSAKQSMRGTRRFSSERKTCRAEVIQHRAARNNARSQVENEQRLLGACESLVQESEKNLEALQGRRGAALPAAVRSQLHDLKNERKALRTRALALGLELKDCNSKLPDALKAHDQAKDAEEKCHIDLERANRAVAAKGRLIKGLESKLPKVEPHRLALVEELQRATIELKVAKDQDAVRSSARTREMTLSPPEFDRSQITPGFRKQVAVLLDRLHAVPAGLNDVEAAKVRKNRITDELALNEVSWCLALATGRKVDVAEKALADLMSLDFPGLVPPPGKDFNGQDMVLGDDQDDDSPVKRFACLVASLPSGVELLMRSVRPSEVKPSRQLQDAVDVYFRATSALAPDSRPKDVASVNWLNCAEQAAKLLAHPEDPALVGKDADAMAALDRDQRIAFNGVRNGYTSIAEGSEYQKAAESLTQFSVEWVNQANRNSRKSSPLNARHMATKVAADVRLPTVENNLSKKLVVVCGELLKITGEQLRAAKVRVEQARQSGTAPDKLPKVPYSLALVHLTLQRVQNRGNADELLHSMVLSQQDFTAIDKEVRRLLTGSVTPIRVVHETLEHLRGMPGDLGPVRGAASDGLGKAQELGPQPSFSRAGRYLRGYQASSKRPKMFELLVGLSDHLSADIGAAPTNRSASTKIANDGPTLGDNRPAVPVSARADGRGDDLAGVATRAKRPSDEVDSRPSDKVPAGSVNQVEDGPTVAATKAEHPSDEVDIRASDKVPAGSVQEVVDGPTVRRSLSVDKQVADRPFDEVLADGGDEQVVDGQTVRRSLSVDVEVADRPFDELLADWEHEQFLDGPTVRPSSSSDVEVADSTDDEFQAELTDEQVLDHPSDHIADHPTGQPSPTLEQLKQRLANLRVTSAVNVAQEPLQERLAKLADSSAVSTSLRLHQADPTWTVVGGTGPLPTIFEADNENSVSSESSWLARLEQAMADPADVSSHEKDMLEDSDSDSDSDADVDGVANPLSATLSEALDEAKALQSVSDQFASTAGLLDAEAVLQWLSGIVDGAFGRVGFNQGHQFSVGTNNFFGAQAQLAGGHVGLVVRPELDISFGSNNRFSVGRDALGTELAIGKQKIRTNSIGVQASAGLPMSASLKEHSTFGPLVSVTHSKVTTRETSGVVVRNPKYDGKDNDDLTGEFRETVHTTLTWQSLKDDRSGEPLYDSPMEALLDRLPAISISTLDHGTTVARSASTAAVMFAGGVHDRGDFNAFSGVGAGILSTRTHEVRDSKTLGGVQGFVERSDTRQHTTKVDAFGGSRGGFLDDSEQTKFEHLAGIRQPFVGLNGAVNIRRTLASSGFDGVRMPDGLVVADRFVEFTSYEKFEAAIKPHREKWIAAGIETAKWRDGYYSESDKRIIAEATLDDFMAKAKESLKAGTVTLNETMDVTVEASAILTASLGMEELALKEGRTKDVVALRAAQEKLLQSESSYQPFLLKVIDRSNLSHRKGVALGLAGQFTKGATASQVTDWYPRVEKNQPFKVMQDLPPLAAGSELAASAISPAAAVLSPSSATFAHPVIFPIHGDDPSRHLPYLLAAEMEKRQHPTKSDVHGYAHLIRGHVKPDGDCLFHSAIEMARPLMATRLGVAEDDVTPDAVRRHVAGHVIGVLENPHTNEESLIRDHIRAVFSLEDGGVGGTGPTSDQELNQLLAHDPTLAQRAIALGEYQRRHVAQILRSNQFSGVSADTMPALIADAFPGMRMIVVDEVLTNKPNPTHEDLIVFPDPGIRDVPVLTETVCVYRSRLHFDPVYRRPGSGVVDAEQGSLQEWLDGSALPDEQNAVVEPMQNPPSPAASGKQSASATSPAAEVLSQGSAAIDVRWPHSNSPAVPGYTNLERGSARPNGDCLFHSVIDLARPLIAQLLGLRPEEVTPDAVRVHVARYVIGVLENLSNRDAGDFDGYIFGLFRSSDPLRTPPASDDDWGKFFEHMESTDADELVRRVNALGKDTNGRRTALGDAMRAHVAQILRSQRYDGDSADLMPPLIANAVPGMQVVVIDERDGGRVDPRMRPYREFLRTAAGRAPQEVTTVRVYRSNNHFDPVRERRQPSAGSAQAGSVFGRLEI